MLALEHLSYRYPGAAQAALDDVSLTAQRGSVLGLLGPNGAGKTTLISHVSGALAVQSGRVAVDGEPLLAMRARMPTRIAVAPQEYAFYPMLTVAENLACFASAGRLTGARKQTRIAACMRFAQIEAFASIRAERLSGGLKRRLNLAIALLPEPELLLFDEPTVGVDPQSRAFVLDAIKTLAAEGAAVIYATHYMEEVEAIADRVAILDNGRVLRNGTLEALLSEGAMVLTVRGDGVDAALLARFGAVEKGPDHWRVRLADDARPAEVLAALDASGASVRQAEFGRYNLEQLFMALTRRSLRDT
ncbi:ABC transporter ATP-binding protein [Variovorax sp. J22R133]|uniref:ABC transporter ATP-binding protein n=1 Tax=Variovorax brevis TaxID=3053503 RepID=UPI002576ACA1|nr:ABC transporter ATP-binding protein [Variovorax sp. J22R133]MDM0115340.1 ABC transporter ATP-binding protein [Variovorax sp. J22R133]